MTIIDNEISLIQLVSNENTYEISISDAEVETIARWVYNYNSIEKKNTKIVATIIGEDTLDILHTLQENHVAIEARIPILLGEGVGFGSYISLDDITIILDGLRVALESPQNLRAIVLY